MGVPDPTGSPVVGVVTALHRFPVKSMAGEALSHVLVNDRGLLDDREWAAYTLDGGIASGKTTRRFRKVEGLLSWRSTASTPALPPELRSPAGETYRVDHPDASRALMRHLGEPLELRREAAIGHHDECGVHLVTMSSIRRVEQLVGGRLDVRRLRANIVLETEGAGFLEDAWCGAELAVGTDVVLRLGLGMPRCLMVDLPQAGVAAGEPVLGALGRNNHTTLGAQALVVHTGTVSLGDEARLTLPRAEDPR